MVRQGREECIVKTSGPPNELEIINPLDRSTQPVNRLAFSILMENTKGASQFRFDSEAASSASKLVYLGRSKISPREILERCPTSVVAGWLAARSHLSAQLRTDFAHVLAAYGYPAVGG